MAMSLSPDIELRRCMAYISGMNADFSVSESATARIAKLLATEPAGSRLRVAVEGGGCSGFQYHFDFTQEKTDDDLEFGTTDAPVLVDNVSLEFIKGSQLDYVATLGAAAFEIKNPNAKASCGCGNSFSVAL